RKCAQIDDLVLSQIGYGDATGMQCADHGGKSGLIVAREGGDDEQIDRLMLRDVRYVADKQSHETPFASVADNEFIKKSPLTSPVRAYLASGKEALSPVPPPLRTARAPFDASSSSIEQRPLRYDPVQLHRPTTPLPGRGCPNGLGVHIRVTTAV